MPYVSVDPLLLVKNRLSSRNQIFCLDMRIGVKEEGASHSCEHKSPVFDFPFNI